MATDLVPAGSASELRERERSVVQVAGVPVLVLWDGESFRALDNRCPHMGFPLHKGDVKDGILACHWHHARFDVTCGATLDPWADDTPCYGIVERDGQVYVDPRLPPRDAREHGRERLQRGLMDDLGLVIAKAIVELEEGGIDRAVALRTAATYGARERVDGWQPGLSILCAMANVLPALETVDRQRALFHGARNIARDCAGRPPRRPLPELSGSTRDQAGLRAWFRETIEVRDSDGAERVLFTIVSRFGATAALDAVLASCTDHRYSDVGHTLDYALKCAEMAEHLDGADTAVLFTSLVPQLAQMQRMEETNAWRAPIDVAALVTSALPDVPAVDGSGSKLDDEGALVSVMLADDPAATITALMEAVREGTSAVALADAVVLAAIHRVLRFGTVNETPDWDTVHHTLTYANAVAEGMRRAPSRELFRAVLDGAMSVYLDRFLNVPPARLPVAESGRDGILDELLAAYDRRSNVDEAAQLAWTHVSAGGDPVALLGALGAAVLREDAGFHPLQQLDIAWRQLDRHGPGQRANLALAACARWIASQFPTRRAMDQTFLISRRLHRGDPVYEE